MGDCPGIAAIAADVISRSLIFARLSPAKRALEECWRAMSVERTDLCSQPLMVESRDHSIGCRSCPTFGGGIQGLFLCFDVLPTKKTGIDGPCTWPDHGCSSTESCQHDRNPRITDVGKSNPQLDDRDQSSHYWCPQADEEEHSGAGTNELQNHRCGNGCARELDNSKANEHRASQNSLKQKPNPWPTVGKGGKKSLQGAP
jgi:hypothetical protein